MTWNYLLPTRKDIPERFQDQKTYIHDEWPETRLGIHCVEASHSDAPWFLGSFAPSTAVLAERGEVVWSFTGKYATGDQTLFTVAGAQVQLIAGGQRVPTDDRGHAVTMTDEHRQGYGRVDLECKRCGLKHTFKTATLEPVIKRLLGAGMREISLKSFKDAVQLSKANA